MCVLGGRLVEEFCRTVRSHLSSFSMVPMCFGALHGRPPGSDFLGGPSFFSCELARLYGIFILPMRSMPVTELCTQL